MDRRLVAVLLVAALAKLALAASWDLLADEAYHFTWALAPAWGYFDQPPLVAWVLAAERAVLGDSAVALRLVPVGLWVAAVGAGADLARDRVTWLLWTLGLPPLAVLTGLAVPDALLLGCWLLGLRAAAAGGRWWWVAGALGGLASLAKYSGAALVPLLIAGASPEERRTAHPWIGLAVALALLAPNLAWNAAHGWVTVRFVVGEGLLHPDAPGPWGPLVQVLDQVLVVGPVAAGAAVVVLVDRVRGWRTLDRVDRMALTTSLPLLVGFTVAAIGGPPEAHWPAPAWIGVGLLLSRASGRIARAGGLGAALGALGTAVLVVHSLRPLARLPEDPGTRLTEGRILGEEIRRWAEPTATDPGRPIVTERYQEASLIRWNTGLDARKLPGCGRASQDDLAHLADRPLPPRAVFVRPSTIGPARCAEARCETVRGPVLVRALDRFDRRVGPWDVFELEGCR